MKKLLTSSIIGGLLLPSLAFAAYNDATITSSADIVIDGVTLDLVGDSNVIETITVNEASFSFTLQNGSTLKVSAANFRQLESNAAAAYRPSRVCEANESSITHTSTSDTAATITVTLGSKICPDASGGSGGGSSSGGGGGSVQTLVAPVAVTANPTIVQLQAQLNALIAQLSALQGSSVASSPALQASGSAKFTVNLSPGSRGASVKALQQFLNKNGFTIASSGPGSPGQETDRLGSLTVQAVKKFQEKYNIAKAGQPGYGVVGPKTRAKINELSGN